MREHTDLSAMVGFVRKHVAQHFHTNRPRLSPAVSQKLLDAAFVVTTALTTAERFSEHLRAASGALGQSRTGLLRRAVRAIELSRNFQMRSGKPDPLAADIVHVREDRGDGTGLALARRFGRPDGRVKMFDKHLVDAIVGGKDPDRGLAEFGVNLVLTRGHGLRHHALMMSGSGVVVWNSLTSACNLSDKDPKSPRARTEMFSCAIRERRL